MVVVVDDGVGGGSGEGGMRMGWVRMGVDGRGEYDPNTLSNPMVIGVLGDCHE